MVTNILIEVLGAVAEQERNKIKQRSAEGVSAMEVVNGKRVSSKTGREYGRPKAEYDKSLMKELSAECNAGKLTVTECCKRLGISRGVWYRKIEKITA